MKEENARIKKAKEAIPKDKVLTLGEMVELAESLNVRLSDVIIAEAMERNKLTYREVIDAVLDAFNFNMMGLEVGLGSGNSFLLGKVGNELWQKAKVGTVLIGDRFLDRAVIYTLATEVGNHEVGLKPCAGTGDSCVYTGLLRALMERRLSHRRLGHLAALIIKIGTLFKEGKKTTGCNMEGFGAGAACTAAALAELRGGTPRQVAKAIVLALSPTIAVPCTPRVIVSGLCATHIGGAILIGNLGANLALKTSMRVDVDVDVMLAMAAKIHDKAAPVITGINLEYMRPYFKTEPLIDDFIAEDLRLEEQEKASLIVARAREEVRKYAENANPLISPFGEAVVGGSSIAVGSPTNMGRIAHELFTGEIKKVTIDLTVDLFARRAINVPGILMGVLFGASTKDIEAYKRVLKEVKEKKIPIEVRKVDEPEVQRIRVETTGVGAYVDALNRGGGRIKIVNAEPSLEAAKIAAERLGIKLAEI